MQRLDKFGKEFKIDDLYCAPDKGNGRRIIEFRKVLGFTPKSVKYVTVSVGRPDGRGISGEIYPSNQRACDECIIMNDEIRKILYCKVRT
tara:strand:- start:3769 stop:4038 length:270 start_codon:yes stop_codon:yes gene_type:complete